MHDHSKAGHKARMRGLSCERRCINYQRENGRRVWRVRGSPTPDFVGWTEEGQHVAGEIKNRVLGPKALKNVGERLLATGAPTDTILEVWMEREDKTWDVRWINRVGRK